MGLRINAGLPAVVARRHLERISSELRVGFERLATGQRISRAADDAAGLALAEALRIDVRQSNKEIENLQSGVSAVRTADAALSTQLDATQRLRELAAQASQGTLTHEQRAALNQEAQQLLRQIDDTATDTEHNGAKLLDGSRGSINLGVEGGAQVNLTESTTQSLGLSNVSLSSAQGARAAIGAADEALRRISRARSDFGAQESRFARAIEGREEAVARNTEAESQIRDAEFARQVIEQTRNEIRLQGNIAVLTQANVRSQAAARLLGP